MLELSDLLSMLLNIDKTLGVWIHLYGPWIYLVLFLIVFGETGLVILPFLPGDSLLFVAGAFAASGSINVWWLCLLLIVAATLGNTVNYAIGRIIGIRVFSMPLRFLDRSMLLKTHVFYEKHGGKTLVIARFLPIVRTFAPFVAGVARMSNTRFQIYNFMGAILWVLSLIFGGYWFGNLPIIRDHLNTIVFVGLASAILPLIFAGIWKLLRPNSDRLDARNKAV